MNRLGNLKINSISSRRNSVVFNIKIPSASEDDQTNFLCGYVFNCIMQFKLRFDMNT